jgi:hypothetical protein
MSFLVLEAFIVLCLVEEYSKMQALSNFSTIFKSTTISGLAFYSLLNSLRARIVNSSDVQEYQNMPLVKYTDDFIFTALDDTEDSYIVQFYAVAAIRQ